MEGKKESRHRAQKVFITEILEGTLKTEEKEAILFLKTPTKEIYRLNIIAVVVGKEKRGSAINLFIDDSTGKITIRFFEDNTVATAAAVGDVLLVIGKTRSYQEEKYISPEIVKKIDHLWLKVRSLELAAITNHNQEHEEEKQIKEEKEDKSNQDTQSESDLLPFEKIIKLIKKMDTGEGVFIEEIIEKSSLRDAEKILEKMLEKGDLFQNQPGRVKVL
ncbi:MAG: hypothetical protein Q8R37_02430 [Nanoarchaeota archaeon]|nr:hypothetical protein [Nanoarchaeota archaeon]